MRRKREPGKNREGEIVCNTLTGRVDVELTAEAAIGMVIDVLLVD